MNEALLYSILNILPEKYLIKEMIPTVMNDANFLEQFYRIHPFPLSLNSSDNEEYIDTLYSLFQEEREKGVLIVDVLYKWWRERLANEFIKINNDVSSFAIFEKQHSQCGLFFSCLFSGAIDHYYFFKQKIQIVVVPVPDYQSNQEYQKAMNLLRSEINQLKDVTVTKLKQVKHELHAKNHTNQQEIKELNHENEQLKRTVRKLERENICLRGRVLIAQKKLVIIGTRWNDEILEEIKDRLYLKSIKNRSSTEKITKLNDTTTSDFVIFSSPQSSHTAYYKLKKNRHLFHTDKMNHEAIMEDFLYWLGGTTIEN
ncbi:MAG: hypothetical protein O2U61_01830 [Candidatus Bathyarchaeota archaeon]|nr:hypothetical protein [Candidatus Bathyarchaeota archaeon]